MITFVKPLMDILGFNQKQEYSRNRDVIPRTKKYCKDVCGTTTAVAFVVTGISIALIQGFSLFSKPLPQVQRPERDRTGGFKIKNYNKK